MGCPDHEMLGQPSWVLSWVQGLDAGMGTRMGAGMVLGWVQGSDAEMGAGMVLG